MSANVRSGAHTRECDARLQHALRTARVGVWYMDLAQNFRVSAQEVAQLIGLPDDAEIDHARMLEVLHPEDRERVQALARKALEEGSRFDVDCRVVWPDGSSHWLMVRGQIHLAPDGSPAFIEGVVQDIDERKRLENELIDSQRTLHSLLDHIPGVIYRRRNDSEWTAEFVSVGVSDLTGYSVDEFVCGGVQHRDLIHPDDRERVSSAMQKALAEHRCYEVNYRLKTKDGGEKWVLEQGKGVYSPQGELNFLEGLIVDISQRKRTEEENAKLESRLRQAQKMEALGTLAGGIAHDFNNMLAAIRGNARLAIEDLPPDSPAIASLREIERSSVRAAELVRQILTFSRQEPSKRRPIDMRATVSEAVRLLRATLPAMIEINTDLASDLPMVRADPTQIHQVLMNLGVNAAHAIGARTGRIDVRLDLVDAAPGEGDSAPRPHVRLQMIDTGGGMDEATMERIFDPFFTTKPAGYGVGLGLSVVHGIMEAHEGAVAVESTPGRGATFSLYFPAIESASAPEPPPLAEAPAGAGQHILYVDDEDALVSLAERGLSRRGYRVSGYVSPTRALEAFRADPQKFDFVVTDLAMPGMSGRDLASELLRIRPDIPIVLTSGRLMPAEVQEMQALGIRNVMPKPSSVDDLARMIAAVLGSRT